MDHPYLSGSIVNDGISLRATRRLSGEISARS
jgi:hypothetical protein